MPFSFGIVDIRIVHSAEKKKLDVSKVSYVPFSG